MIWGEIIVAAATSNIYNARIINALPIDEIPENL